MWNGGRKFAFILFCIFFADEASSYGLLRSSYGAIIQWPGKNPNVKIYLTPANSHGISEEDIKNIFSVGISQWNALGNIKASSIVVSDYSTPSRASRNDAYFSKNPLFFNGSGVLAVTQITFRENDGVILESDIIFKDITASENLFKGIDFATVANNFHNPYIGAVMTHELGHFLGLGHSQVLDSTMFYVSRRGQHQAIEDDRAGVQELYGKQDRLGSIFGNIIGGNQENIVGIFGSHVKVISMQTGRVVAGSFSNENGSFSVPGLDLNDTYFLYVEPTKNSEAIPGFYSTAKRDFCNERSSYEGAFFQSCNSSDKGHPQGISLSGERNNGNVGNISIQCGLDTPVEYRDSKEQDEAFEVPVVNGDSLGNSFVGSFDYFDIENRTPDVIDIDLEDFDVPSNDYYLELKVVYQALYSKFKMDMRVESDTYDSTFDVTSDDYDNPVLDIVARIPLNTDSMENKFTLTLTPEKFLTYLVSSPYSREGEGAFYPNGSSFYDNRTFYFFIANIVRQTSSNQYVTENFRQYSLSDDNASCPGGKFAYSVSGNVRPESEISSILRGLNNRGNDDGEFVSCGTVDMQDGGGGGGALLGVLMGFLLVLFTTRSIGKDCF